MAKNITSLHFCENNKNNKSTQISCKCFELVIFLKYANSDFSALSVLSTLRLTIIKENSYEINSFCKPNI